MISRENVGRENRIVECFETLNVRLRERKRARERRMKKKGGGKQKKIDVYVGQENNNLSMAGHWIV